MRKIFLLAVIIFSSIFFFSSLTNAAVEIYTDVKECNNGPSRTNSGGCGTACGSLCSDSNFTYDTEGASDCRVSASSTGAWTKYKGTRNAYTFSDCNYNSLSCGIDYYKFTFVRLESVCSTADKHYPNRSNKYNLYAGYCSCGSVGSSPYKACCVINSDETRSPVDAITDYSVNDGYDPPEGGCPGGSQVVMGSSCPQPPTVSLVSDCNSSGTPILKWWSDADRCVSNDFSTGDDPANNTGVSAEADKTYTITCSSDYSYYRPDYSGGLRSDSASTSASVTAKACTNCPAPAACYIKQNSTQTSCADFNKSEATLSDGTKYSSTYTPKGTGSEPCGVGSNNLCCLATHECGRCSNTPGNETTWVDWTDSNGDNVVCNDYNNNRRVSANDARCAAPYYTCNASNSCAKVSDSDAKKCAAGEVTTSGKKCFTSSNCDNTCGTTPPSSAFSVSLTASPSSINRGGSSTLSWTSAGVTSCSLNQGIGSVLTSSTRAVSPATTTTYTITCADSSGGTTSSSATVTVNGGSSCYTGPRSVSADISATRDCLPEQPGQIVDTRLNWSGSVSNQCPSIIGGGSPSNYSLSCSNSSSNWSGSGSGTTTISGGSNLNGVSRTQDYSLSCSRSDYTCSSSQTFASHDDQNSSRCSSSCSSLRSSYPAINSCSCSQGSCVEYWHDDEHCTARKCGTTHEVCGSCCTGGWGTNPETGAVSCLGSSPCNCHDVCNYDGDCIAWSCKYYAEDQSVSSQNICSSSDSDSQQVRFIEKPGVPTNDLTTSPFKAQILLNQLINLIWNVSMPNSGVPTTLRCTPSVRSGGDGRGWTGAQDSLQSSGTKNSLSPKNTTTYRLDCRNRDNVKPSTCYNDSDRKEFEEKVFEPTIEEKSPTLREIFGKVFSGLIPDKFKNF